MVTISIILEDQEDSLFAGLFREGLEELAKATKDPTLLKEDGFPIAIPSSFTPFDYRNGMKVKLDTTDGNTQFIYDALGLATGSLNMYLGKNGSGKTAMAIQKACSIAQRFKNSFIFHFDLERGTNKMRILNLSGWSSKMLKKYWLKSGAMSIEMITKIILEHADQKRKAAILNPAEAMYFTGTYDVEGKKVYEMVPTICILDSVPMLYSAGKDGKKDENTSNMTGARNAKAISDMIKNILPEISQTNIIVLAINHINQKINTGFFPTQAQNNYLSQDESIPGGNTLLYLCNNVTKITTSTKLTEDKNPFGDFTGFHSKFKIVKSRSNCAGQEDEMIYNQEYGYDRLLSTFMMVKNAGLVRGSGWYYLEGLPNIKFQQKTFKEKLYENDIMKQAFKQLIQHVGNDYLSGNAKAPKLSADEQKSYLDDFAESIRYEMMNEAS